MLPMGDEFAMNFEAVSGSFSAFLFLQQVVVTLTCP
jgi:hypothetical protein